MTREEQIREAAKKTTGLFSYRNGYSTAEDAFIAGAEWADANPCMPDRVVKIPERSREKIKELLDNWEGTIVAGGDISISPWISVEERLPEKGVLVIVKTGIDNCYLAAKDSVALPKDEFMLPQLCEYVDGVTHWMPIPELPKEEKK